MAAMGEWRQKLPALRVLVVAHLVAVGLLT
jgi:hypothetical protein